jgi:putative heme-binding domain-containing protein
VQFQLVCTLGQLPKEQTFQTKLQVGLRHIDDQWFQLAVLTCIREDASRWYQVVTSQRPFVGNPSSGAGSFLAQLASILGARQKDREIADVLTAVSKSRSERDAWWQVASLEGLANGLKRGAASQVKLPTGQPHLLQLLATRSTLIQNAALRVMTQVDLVATPELRTAMAKASRVALSQDAKLEDRTQAIGILGLDSTASTLPSLEKFLSPQQPQEIQVAAVGALSNLRDPRVAALLLERWRTYTSPVRQAALAGLLSDRNRLLALLDSIKAAKVQPWSLTRTMRSQLLHSPDPEIGQKAKILLVDSSDNDRKAVFEKYKPALRLPGNPEHGKQIFNEVCSKCHKIGSMGYEVGPDLLSVTGRPKGQLMTDILMPNLNLEDGYEEYLAQTTDGRLITGVISKQNPMAVTLRRAKGEEDTILRSNITNLRSLSLSPMPEDLEKGINLEGMADLLAFLKSL